LYNLGNNWTLNASAHFLVGGSGTWSFPGTPSDTAGASYSRYEILVGRQFGDWTAELGYRLENIGSSSTDPNYCSCQIRSSGFLLGLTKSF